MKVMNEGSTFTVHGDYLGLHDRLPAQVYDLRFSDRKGFYLENTSDTLNVGEKVYGIHTDKANKVLNSFAEFNRSLGVILSGNKGIGKSLFSKMLSAMAIERGIPVITVNNMYGGMSAYLETINQEVLVLFDEFDKTYGSDWDDEDTSKQNSLLTLFDGLTQTKKLFVITCNDMSGLSEYIVNRPGRFHYHFRFKYPTPSEIREYLTDKLKPEYTNQIDDVVTFASKIDLNYDCLRAIAFEINTGLAFKDAIMDLNIINNENVYYELEIKLKNGEQIEATKRLDLFEEEIGFTTMHKNVYIDMSFDKKDMVFDEKNDCINVDGENVDVECDSKDCYKVASIKIRKRKEISQHYTV